MTVDETAHVVVIGGGIAGLSAAFFLRDEPVRVTVLEGSPRLGGKLSASDVAGVAMDEGAEALLARRPEGIELITAVGLGGDLVPAGVTSSAIYTRGAMRSLPRRQFMGVPADLDELSATGVVSPEGVARARDESSGRARPAMCRSRSTSARASVPRSLTGSSTRCSAACTRAGRRTCPSWPRSHRSRRRRPGTPP